jgi:prefoldin beta subunit
MDGFFSTDTDGVDMQGNLPPEAQEKIDELKDLQETAQQVAAQKQQAETQLTESEAALDALEDVADDTVMYREVGELLIETEYDEAHEDLEEKVDSLEVRVDTLEKQEERVQTQFEELQQELQQMLGGGAGGGPVGGPGAGGA